MRLLILLTVFIHNPKNQLVASISTFIVGYNVNTQTHEMINFYLKEAAFVVSITAGLFSVYLSIRKIRNERISKRER